jgi:UDP-GlcNAc:undecaprenyl-phosphate/decaprenyl-phosphate GlcNAc-1-phosphate transferase
VLKLYKITNFMQAQTIFYFLTFVICLFSFVSSKFLTKWIVLQSQKWMILDNPSLAADRKFQEQPVPLLGGLSFIITCGLGSILVWLIHKNNLLGLQDYLGQNLDYVFKMSWILVGGLVLAVGGILDDKYTFSTKWLALSVFIGLCIAVFGGGLSIDSFSFPFDKILPENSLLSSILAFVWIGLCVCATKFLDGHDGLVASVGILNLAVIALIASFTNINQPLIIILSLVWASGILGFLPYNLPNAKIYLGESGSEIIGFVIGVLSILSGAKVATTSGIIGWFIFDLILVIYLRKKAGKSVLKAGREHWHFRLLDSGLTKAQVLILTLFILIISSILSIFLPTAYKLFSILGQFAILIIIFILTEKKTNKQSK